MAAELEFCPDRVQIRIFAGSKSKKVFLFHVANAWEEATYEVIVQACRSDRGGIESGDGDVRAQLGQLHEWRFNNDHGRSQFKAFGSWLLL